MGLTLIDRNDYIRRKIHSGKLIIIQLKSVLSIMLKFKVYKIILTVVLYGCETWSLTLREVLKLQVSENEVLRKIFGCKDDEVGVHFRILQNEECGR
jgi:hypothetical protein